MKLEIFRNYPSLDINNYPHGYTLSADPGISSDITRAPVSFDPRSLDLPVIGEVDEARERILAELYELIREINEE